MGCWYSPRRTAQRVSILGFGSARVLRLAWTLTSFHLRLSRAPACTPRCAEMASPDSGARAIVANASGDAAEDGDALASKRRRLADADAEPSQADDSVSDGATRRAHRWRRQTPRDPAEGFDGWHDLPEGILLSVFESLARGPDGRRLVCPSATTARAHPRILRGARPDRAHELARTAPSALRRPGPPPDLTRPFPLVPISRAALQLRSGVQGVARRRDARPDERHGGVRPRRASVHRGRRRRARTFQAKRRRRHRDDAARETRRERRDGC